MTGYVVAGDANVSIIQVVAGVIIVYSIRTTDILATLGVLTVENGVLIGGNVLTRILISGIKVWDNVSITCGIGGITLSGSCTISMKIKKPAVSYIITVGIHASLHILGGIMAMVYGIILAVAILKTVALH